jgi:peptide chain release factor 3
MGKTFRGVYHLLNDRLLHFAAGEERRSESERSTASTIPARCPVPGEVGKLREDVDLIQSASSPFDLVGFLAGRQSPVFFGSAINNFGVQEILQALLDWAPPPQERDGGCRLVEPAEPPSAASCSRSRPTWTPSTATALPSSASAPVATRRE